MSSRLMRSLSLSGRAHRRSITFLLLVLLCLSVVFAFTSVALAASAGSGSGKDLAAEAMARNEVAPDLNYEFQLWSFALTFALVIALYVLIFVISEKEFKGVILERFGPKR